MRRLLFWLDYWKWWIIVPLILLGFFIFILLSVNSTANNYVKCREAHKDVDICLIGTPSNE